MKIRLFSLWLLLSVAVGLSAYDFMVDGLCYNITSSTAPYTVEVTYEQYPNGAIYKSMTTANIPESVTRNNRVYRVTSIGESAFYGCTSLTSIIIPNSVTRIGNSAFYGCTSLTSIIIPNSVTRIGNSAFYYCTGLTSVTIPNSVTSIGESVFSDCRGLTSVTIGNSVTSIGKFAFKRCSRLTSIIWNAKACSDFIDYNTPFYYNNNFDIRSQITSFIFGDSVQYIPAYLCNGLRNLTSITIPNSVTSIEEGAFEDCTGLISITIPNSVTSIGKYVFYGCTGLTSTTIGNSVTSIGDYAFRGCTGFTSITIPNSVTSIGGYAFNGCKGLSSVTIGNSVTSMGEAVFKGCTSLTSVVWNAKNYNDFSEKSTPFYYEVYYSSDDFDIRPQITSFVFGDNVQHIPDNLCAGMENLVTITIGKGVTSIGGSAFRECTGLTKVNYAGDIKGWLDIEMEYWDSNPLHYAKKMYINDVFLTDLVIPESVTIISFNFSGYQSLTSVIIPNSVTSIGESAFSDCRGLTSVTIGNSVTSIGSDAFDGCNSLTSVVWNAKNCNDFSEKNTPFYYKGAYDYNNFDIRPQIISFVFGDSVQHIPDYLCNGMKNLTSITIPNSVTSIGNFTFKGCTSIASVVWNAKNYKTNTPFYYDNNFDIRPQITSFIFGDSVQYIPVYLCSGLRNLTSITIPNSVTDIGGSAFESCTGLTSITIPNSVTDIGNYAFCGCTGLTSITIPSGVTSIGKSAFSGTSITSVDWNAKISNNYSYNDTPFDHYNNNFDIRPQITSFVFGDSVQYIPAYLCSGMKNLTTITIPNSVTGIGKSAFSGCTGLTSLSIGDSVTNIGDDAFSNCSGLVSITISNSVTNIGNGAFGGCTGLTSITIPNSVTDIGGSAFYGCTGLTSITIPNSVTDIGGSAFYGCTGLTSITIPNSVTDIGGSAFEGCTGLISITIPNGVTSIGGRAFYGCTGLTSVTIPNSVTSIGNGAFTGTSIASVVWNAKSCNAFSSGNTPFYYKGYYSSDNSDIRPQITSFVFGDSVQHIPNYLCAGMTNLTSVTILNGVASIGGHAFSDCTGLASITIGNSVKSIGDNTFSGCTGLTSVVWNAKNYNDFSEKSTPFYYNGNYQHNFDIRPQITSFVFGDSVQHIPAYLCTGMENLATITVGNSVTSIGRETFRDCTGLTSITIPNSVTSIEWGAFSGCTSFTSVVWNAKNCNDFSEKNTPFYYNSRYSSDNFDLRPQITSFAFGDSVQYIPAYLCSGMKNLTSVTIGNSVTSIGNRAFWGCSGLTSITILDSVTSIGGNAFSNCTGLISITIPNSVTSIGGSAFSDCTGLTSVVIGNGVTNIEDNAFKGCKNVETVVFGSAVETIGASAFAGCQSIYEMTIYATKVPIIQENTFTEVGTGATLRVPAGCAKKYKAHPYWGVFNIEEIPSEYTLTVTCDPQYGQVSGSGTYTDGSEVTLTAVPNKGYAFTQWSDGNKDNPRKVTVTADATYTAEFALLNYVVTATCDPQQGQVTGGGTYLYGSEVTLTAVPNDGYTFKQWSDGTLANPYSFPAEKDVNIKALFEPTTPVENVAAEENNAPRKVFRNGQVLILRNGKTYTLTGEEVE